MAKILPIAIAVLFLSSCGPTHFTLAPKTYEIPIEPIPDGKGELVVYRVNPYGILKTPYLAANGQVFGQCSYKKAIFKILDSGFQTISVGSNKFDVQIVEGKRTYASCIPWKLIIEESDKGAEITKKLETIEAY